MGKRRQFRVSKPARSSSRLRRSPRLQEIAQKAALSSRQLPSPTPSRLQPQLNSKKRRYSDSIESTHENEYPTKRRTLRNHPELTLPSSSDPVAYWVANKHCWPKTWPKYSPQELGEMSLPTSSKRKSSSTHHSDRQKRMENNGVFMDTSTKLQQSSKDLCRSLLEGDRKPDQFPCYPATKVNAVLGRVQILNEARLQRDVTPLIVPSPENLFFSDELKEDYIGEEVQAEWIRCEPMGGRKPKPDLTVGLQRKAFGDNEWAKLENYTTSRLHFHFTPDLWFPFLICEAKTDRVGLEPADMQNIHSGSIAVRSIVRLYTAAYGQYHQKVADLSGRVLAFSVSHNCQQANLYGHFAVAKDGSNKNDEAFEYFRYGIAIFSLRMADGEERYKAYNFVRNVYDKFAPEHRNRIREAINEFDEPTPRTGLSFAASSLGLDDDGESRSDGTPSQEAGVFKTPSEPASAATRREIGRLVEQLEQQRKESKEKEERMEREMGRLIEELERQRQESKEQLEQQRKESREREERAGEQMEQLMKVISTLGEAKVSSAQAN